MFRCSHTIIREHINSCLLKQARINALPDDGVTAPK